MAKIDPDEMFDQAALRLAQDVATAAAAAGSGGQWRPGVHIGPSILEMARLSPKLSVELSEAILDSRAGADVEFIESGYEEASAHGVIAAMLGGWVPWFWRAPWTRWASAWTGGRA